MKSKHGPKASKAPKAPKLRKSASSASSVGSSNTSNTLNTANTANTWNTSSSAYPAPALRRGKFDNSPPANQSGLDQTHQPHPSHPPLPDLYIIYSIYGHDTSLYDVLQVQPCADATDIRRAYLKQGRRALLDHGMAQPNRRDGRGGWSFRRDGHEGCEVPPPRFHEIPKEARQKFQAISIAYEILSEPAMRGQYNEYLDQFDYSDTKSLESSLPHIPLSRSRSGNSSHSVRWKPYVEEKWIVDSHPDEHSHNSQSKSTASAADEANKANKAAERERREAAAAAAESNRWLESHLSQLDKEAEQFFNGDLMDELDVSLSSFQESLGAMMNRVGRNDRKEGKKNNERRSERNSERSRSQSSLGSQSPQHSSRSRRKEGLVMEDDIQPSNDPNGLLDSLDSPCSVLDVEKVADFVEGMAGNLANAFISILDGAEQCGGGGTNENNATNANIVTSPTNSTNAAHANNANIPTNAINGANPKDKFAIEMRESFGDPFYAPSENGCNCYSANHTQHTKITNKTKCK